jgi:hypothetical protein
MRRSWDGQWEARTFLEEVRDSATRFALTDGGSHTLSWKDPAVR